jgi:hypothetical protein
VYDRESGVLLKLLWMELPLTEVRKELTEAQRK